jgi:tRNA G18 (ribose-2'-O)-methylase SpoU
MSKHDLAKFASILLYNVRSGVNLGQIMRTLEQFQVWLRIYDPDGVWARVDQKTVSDFSCGALWRFEDIFVKDFEAFRKSHEGRVIVTCLDDEAVPLDEFKLREDDVIVMGNEYDGVPPEVIAAADVKLYIPLPKGFIPKSRSFSPIDPSRTESVNQNGVPNLSVSISTGIVAYALHLQRTAMLAARTSEVPLCGRSGRSAPPPPSGG